MSQGVMKEPTHNHLLILHHKCQSRSQEAKVGQTNELNDANDKFSWFARCFCCEAAVESSSKYFNSYLYENLWKCMKIGNFSMQAMLIVKVIRKANATVARATDECIANAQSFVQQHLSNFRSVFHSQNHTRLGYIYH